ncbi:MAG TPA: hypothetical protein VH640_11780 [Bryobacteraceae bacterium]|jgi:hypothetical protein
MAQDQPAGAEGKVQVGVPEGGKLFFSGPPSAVRGRIPLVNPTAEKLKIRSLGINAKDLRGPAQAPLTECPIYARLAPGAQASVAASLHLDHRTEAGQYEVEIRIAGRTIPATAQVTEVVDLDLQPASITIIAGSRTSYTRQLTAINNGNVPLPMGARCEAPLREPVDLETLMLVGLAKAPNVEAKRKVAAWLDEWGQTVGGSLVVTRDPVVVRPGQTVTADVQFEIPPSLKPLRHYRAALSLYNAALTIDIYTTAKAGSAGEENHG